MSVLQDASIDEVFRLLQVKTGLPPRNARLVHAGVDLEQNMGNWLSDYPAIVHGTTLFLLLKVK